MNLEIADEMSDCIENLGVIQAKKPIKHECKSGFALTDIEQKRGDKWVFTCTAVSPLIKFQDDV